MSIRECISEPSPLTTVIIDQSMFCFLFFSLPCPKLKQPSGTQLQPYQPVSGLSSVLLHFDVAQAG